MPDVFVARQPIFDLDDRLLGYELLYRSSSGANGTRGALRGPRPSDTAVHAMIGIGVNRFANGALAFVDFTREFLLDSLHDLFEPGTLVVEVSAAARCDEETLAACERLVRDGHRLALDDFTFAPGCEPLLRLADIVKVDVRDRSPEELADLAERLRPFDVRLLAQCVESAAVRDECARAGFELFQGYFFARPELLARRAFGEAQEATVRVMNLLRDPTASDAEVERAFRADPSLAHKLLCLANAAAPRVGNGDAGVDSVLVAQHLVGRETIAHWLALLLVSSLGSPGARDAELVRMSMVRGRMCELIADERREASAPFLLTGLLSNLDALLQAPMEEILQRLRTAPVVREALLERRGPCADALELAELYERGAWREMAAAAAHLGVSTVRVAQMYTDALGWTRERLARWERANG